MGYNYHWGLEQKFTTRSSINQIQYVNELIAGLKSDGNWDEIDVLWVPAVEAQQQAVYEWKSEGASFTLTEVNSPTWTAKQGYTGASTKYLNSNWNPSTNGVKFVRDSASHGVYTRTNISQGVNEYGAINASLQGNVMNPRGTSNLIAIRVNGLVTSTGDTTTDCRGLNYGRRTSSTDVKFGKNGSDVFSAVNTSVAPPSLVMVLLARNNNGTIDAFSTKQSALFFFGSNSINQATLYTRVQNYMTQIGAQV